MKKINTKNGERWIQSFPAAASFWALWKSPDKPSFCSVKKSEDQKTWWVTVWGETQEECQENVKILARLQAGAAPREKGPARGGSQYKATSRSRARCSCSCHRQGDPCRECQFDGCPVSVEMGYAEDN